VIILLSGGGSSLLALPPEGVNIADLQKLNQLLLSSGADIHQINTIRKHVSLIKGGQLSRFLAPAKVITLILSDVIGDSIDMIASGPTYPDPSTYADALSIIDSYGLIELIPATIIKHLELGSKNKIPDTPKPGDDTFTGSSHYVIAGNQDAISGAEKQARQEGFHTIIDSDPLLGEAKHVGARLGRELINLVDSIERPACLISGGETTVTLSGTSSPGMGGRNLELALSASFPLAGSKDVCLVTLATDGEDGTSPAAGAVVTGESLQKANDLGLNPKDYLDRHDSYAFFESLDDLIKIGSTQTNVNDLCFRFLW
jgi:hydroxypyruvate reductase